MLMFYLSVISIFKLTKAKIALGILGAFILQVVW